jgi:hypothetical protein
VILCFIIHSRTSILINFSEGKETTWWIDGVAVLAAVALVAFVGGGRNFNGRDIVTLDTGDFVPVDGVLVSGAVVDFAMI